MNRNQAGFTLIELVMVIVILGVLAAVAVPKYLDIKSDANQAAVSGVAGALGAGAAANYAARTANSSKGVAVLTCDAAKTTLLGGALPTNGGNYQISDGSSATGVTAITAGNTASCTLTFTPTSGSAVTATFSVTAIA